MPEYSIPQLDEVIDVIRNLPDGDEVTRKFILRSLRDAGLDRSADALAAMPEDTFDDFVSKLQEG